MKRKKIDKADKTKVAKRKKSKLRRNPLRGHGKPRSNQA